MRATVQARPFLKWAGGKRQLLPQLRRYYPPDFGAYFEPFLGSGAVFFDLYATDRLDGRPVVLTDTNPDVVGCYRALRDHVDEVIAHLKQLAVDHARAGAAHYYAVREERFNPWRQALFPAAPDAAPEERADTGETAPGSSANGGREGPAYPPELAAMLIYLNRTGYNGLFRLNRRGGFNVPVGRYTNPKICDEEMLRAAAAALGRQEVTLAHESFDSVGARAQAGDFVYFDPPYAPLSPTARFTAYTAEGFDGAAQTRLQRLMIDLARRGCHVLLSNSTAPAIRALYERSPEARDAGLRAAKVPARRAINSRATRRGAVREYLITNLPKSRG